MEEKTHVFLTDAGEWPHSHLGLCRRSKGAPVTNLPGSWLPMKEIERTYNTHVSVRKTCTLVQKHARVRFRRDGMITLKYILKK